MPRFVTDKKLAELTTIEDPELREQTLADSGRLYAYVRRNEWIDETALRGYGERNGIGPDELNRAIALLTELGELHSVPDSPVLPTAPAVAPVPPA